MDTLSYPNIEWRAVEFTAGKREVIPPLANRIDQAALIYFDRTHTPPNVILLRGDDFAQAEDTYIVPLPNGKSAAVEVLLSPFPKADQISEILVGRREVTE